MKPVIGITSYAEEVTLGRLGRGRGARSDLLRARDRARGGRPLIVPPSEDSIDETLAVLDGIVFSGGSDLDPAQYGDEPHPETDEPREVRDRAEMALLTAALERDMPVLAVCRGSQVLNVALGGDLVQHLPDAIGHEGHRHQPGAWSDHEVKLEPESRVGGLLGERAPVKSHHHQGYGRIGEGLREAGVGRRRHGRGARGSVEAVRASASSGIPRKGRTWLSSRRSWRRPAGTGRRADDRRPQSGDRGDDRRGSFRRALRRPTPPSRPRELRSRPGAPWPRPTVGDSCAGSLRSSRSTPRSSPCSRPATSASRSRTRGARSAWSPRSSTSTRARSTSTTARRSRSRAAST